MKPIHRILLTAGILSPTCALAAETVQATSNRPTVLPFSEKHLEALHVPDGFRVSVFATDLKGARMMAVTTGGTVFLTRPIEGEVVALTDAGDGKPASGKSIVLTGHKDVHGITLQGDRVLLATPTQVLEARMDGEKLSTPRVLVDRLPDGGQHANRTLHFSPKGELFVSVGSSCNACEETNPEHATLLVVDPATGRRDVFARGLRNTIGFDWHPTTHELWGMDHGSDMLGDEVPPEELNLLEKDGDYGWPWAYGKNEVDPHIAEPDKGPKKAERARASRPMVLGYLAHAAPIEMVFYTGKQFGEEMQGDAFIAFHGSWNRARPVGYEVVRLDFTGGKPTRFEPFLTGFLDKDGKSCFGRPAGLAIARDGSLLVSDDAGGVIYRVSRK